jgi:hypothetical protein
LGIGYSIDQRTPTVLRRRQNTTRARFTTVYDLTGAGEFVTGVDDASQDGEPAVVVHTRAGRETIRFARPEAAVPAKP